MLDIDRIDLSELATALEDHSPFEHRWLINPETGEIVFWTADEGIDDETPAELGELDLVAIEPLPSYVWHQDMVDFAELVSDEKAARRLGRALGGRGGFRRFREELREEYPDLLPVWYAFRDARALRRAVDWLLDNSLVADDAADRFRARHPDPGVP